jgi:polyhydroxyalkanoate synthesis regulator phasin
MEQYLQQMSLPTQSEVVSLAERLTTIEMRLDDMDEKLDEILDQLKEKSGS